MEDRRKKEKINIERKIELIGKYLETGSELNGASILDGYPVGTWAINIRSAINAISKGNKKYKITLKPTEEQIEKLQKMGVLERQIGPTLDEKVEKIISWQSKYPKAHISTSKISNEVLKEYAKSEEEYKKLCDEYEKMKSYYGCVRNALSRGKLTENQIVRCREANIGGKFGKSKTIKWIAKQCGENEKIISYIIEKYEDLNVFADLYRKGKLSESDEILAKGLVKNVLDIDGSPKSSVYNKLYQKLFDINESDSKLRIYSSGKLEDAMDTLPEKYKSVVIRRFGLSNENLPKDLKSIATEFNASPEWIRVLEKKALEKLKEEAIEKNVEYNLEEMKENHFVSEEEKMLIEQIEKDIYNSKLLIYKNIRKELLKDDCKLLGEMNFIKNMREVIKQKETNEDNEKRKVALPIEKLNLSIRTFNCLKRAGINTLGDIQNLTEKELKNVKGFGTKGYEEVKVILENNQLCLAPKRHKKSSEKKKNTDLEAAKYRKKELLAKLENLKEKNRKAEELEKEYEKLQIETEKMSNKNDLIEEIEE